MSSANEEFIDPFDGTPLETDIPANYHPPGLQFLDRAPIVSTPMLRQPHGSTTNLESFRGAPFHYDQMGDEVDFVPGFAGYESQIGIHNRGQHSFMPDDFEPNFFDSTLREFDLPRGLGSSDSPMERRK